MSKLSILIPVVVALLALALMGLHRQFRRRRWFRRYPGGKPRSPTPTPMGTLTVPPGATVELTVDGPVPREVTIKAGNPVLFILRDEEYGQSTVKFDRVNDINVGTMLWLLPGESRVFTRLNDKPPGTYPYEMLTRPENKGTVIVE